MQHNYNFIQHNSEVKEVWNTYNAGNPIRTPMILSMSPRSYLSDPTLNTEKITYQQYHKNPDVMMDIQLKFNNFEKHNVFYDHEMGLPDEWNVYLDGGNFQHSAWYGCDISYMANDSPDTKPLLNNDNKNMLFDKGLPDPFSGLYAKYKNMYEYMYEKVDSGYYYKDRPISKKIGVPMTNLGGNGVPFTTACKLRGTTNFCMDMMLDPEYAIKLLDFITQAILNRIKVWRKFVNIPLKQDHVGTGDDSIVLISPNMYKTMVMPFHKILFETLGNEYSSRGIHLCGDAMEHFKVLRNELNVTEFDTGFPLDLKKMYEYVGKECRINGGLHIELIRLGTKHAIENETEKILNELKEYKKFVFRDANHLAPKTSLGNIRTMYNACRKFGKY